MSRPTTVTLKAIRRSWLRVAVSPLARPVSAGESGISVPISPSAGPKRTSMRVRPSRRWASKSKSASALLSWCSLAVGARVGDDEGQRVGHRGAAGHAADGGGGGLAVAGGQRAPGGLGARGQRGEAAAAPGAELDQETAQLEDDEREREQGQDEHRDLQRTGDMKDRLVDVAGAHGA